MEQTVTSIITIAANKTGIRTAECKKTDVSMSCKRLVKCAVWCNALRPDYASYNEDADIRTEVTNRLH